MSIRDSIIEITIVVIAAFVTGSIKSGMTPRGGGAEGISLRSMPGGRDSMIATNGTWNKRKIFKMDYIAI